MAINYGTIERGQRKRKPRAKALIDHKALESPGGELTGAGEMKARLRQLAMQNRAPSVAKAAATELLEREEPKKIYQDPGISGADAVRIADIYEMLFCKGCPECGYVAKEQP